MATTHPGPRVHRRPKTQTSAASAAAVAVVVVAAPVLKVSKPDQDFRFDVPVIGPVTIDTAHAAKVRVLGVEAGRTLLLERRRLIALADERRISIFGVAP